MACFVFNFIQLHKESILECSILNETLKLESFFPIKINSYQQYNKLSYNFDILWFRGGMTKQVDDNMWFVFVDDDGVTLQSVKPCPVSKAFVDDFTARCKSCAYTVSCIDCGVELLDSGSLQDHMLLFDHTHVLTSRSTVSKVNTRIIRRFRKGVLTYACTRTWQTFLHM